MANPLIAETSQSKQAHRCWVGMGSLVGTSGLQRTFYGTGICIGYPTATGQTKTDATDLYRLILDQNFLNIVTGRLPFDVVGQGQHHLLDSARLDTGGQTGNI